MFTEYNLKSALWDSLTESEKQAVLNAFMESEDEDNLIDFEIIKKKYSFHTKSLLGKSSNTKF